MSEVLTIKTERKTQWYVEESRLTLCVLLILCLGDSPLQISIRPLQILSNPDIRTTIVRFGKRTLHLARELQLPIGRT